jgi:ribosome-associated protein
VTAAEGREAAVAERRAETPGASAELARRVASIVDQKQGERIVALDVRELVSYTDYLVIATARNERQAKAIVDEVKMTLKKEEELLPGGTDGDGAAGWIVLDFLDAVLHVFTDEARRRYQLEDLWREAPRLDLPFLQDDVRGHLYGAAHG